MIKILIITTSDLIAGAEKSIYDVLLLIDKTRYEPRLIILKHEKNGDLVDKVRKLGIRVDLIGIQSKWQFFKLIKVWNLIKEFNPNILESFLFFDNQVARVFGKLLGVPIIISGQQNVYLKRSWIRNSIEKITIPFANHIISNSEAGKLWYLDRGYLPVHKISVIKSGIDFDQLEQLQARHVRTGEKRFLFNKEIPKNAIATVSIGFLSEQKGFEYLLQAAQLLDEYPCIHFFIIGDGILKQELEILSQKLHISDRVHIVGFQESASQYLHLFDIFILSSLWEGLPNVVIEAMASKVPIIATRVGGVDEIIKNEKTGILIPSKDSEAIAEAIKKLMSISENKKQEIINNAYSYSQQNLSTQKMVADRQFLYEKLLAQHKK